MSALRQHDGIHTGAILRGVTSLRRAGAGFAYFDPHEVPRTANSVLYGHNVSTCVTCTHKPLMDMFVVVGTLGTGTSHRFQAFAEQITRDLDRLTDGWYGPGSKSPGHDVLRDVDAVLSQFLSGAYKPEVEIDEDTGAVTLRWGSASSNVTLALVFNGNGHVVVVNTVVAQETVATSKSFKVEDHSGIARFFASDDGIATLFDAA